MKPAHPRVRLLSLLLPLLVSGLATTGLSPLWSGDDHQLWTSFSYKAWQRGPTSVSLYGEVRLRDDGSEPFGYFYGSRLARRLHPRLTLAAALKGIEIKSADHFSHLTRYELEAELFFPLSGDRQLKLRERIEAIARPDRSTRTRFRSLLSYPWPLELHPFSGLASQDEIFIEDGPSQRIRENRFMPLVATWKFQARAALKVGYLLRSTELADDWRHEHMLNLAFSFSH